MQYIMIGAAGMVGALLRFFLGIGVNGIWEEPFPVATLLANLIGSFTLGFVTMYLFQLKKVQGVMATTIGTGLIGSFTTFSTFSVETVALIRDSHYFEAFLYAVISLVGGLFMAWAGYLSGRHLYNRRKGEG
ncbi:fluoride efflux transporter CrcB [Bacillus sp. KH172YL63]|uniref:fluoride efflux transporter CrcB n=1 Tax=Bacillus sp. KH172YL63 TaxID=2709784 RepID=UPI0013E4574D|nr:fluoride efflux transporter CrcB [Bacillus sp. KH172YL63]BCB03629.1 putative fluoride ion transporter CrcB 1 [Bacillus sp. KH172YL63]